MVFAQVASTCLPFPAKNGGGALALPSIAGSALLAAACALPLAPAVNAQTGIFPAPEFPCNLPTSRSLIIWQTSPTGDPTSSYVNESDISNCRPTLSEWRIRQPKGPGYCSKIAWSADNPGYVPSVVPAAPLENVLDQVGDC
jgi:hypothetical protein